MRENDRNQEKNNVTIRNQICKQTCEKYIKTDFFELCQGRFSLVLINLSDDFL